MNELELWKRIAANAHKVPGLSVTGLGDIPKNLYIEVESKPYSWFSDLDSQDSFDHRSAALLVVDAIEATGCVAFNRQPIGTIEHRRIRWVVHMLPGPYPLAENKQEHIALLECLSITLEALPEPQEVQK